MKYSTFLRAELCYTPSAHGRRDLNLFHFNSPHKLDVKIKDVSYFRNHFLTFQQYDGGLLRRELIADCPDSDGWGEEDEGDGDAQEGDEEDDCFEIRRAKKAVYR